MVVEMVADEQADRIFHALADPTRRDILRRATVRGHSVSSLARRYPISFAAVQKHVAVLERATLVTKERRGREQVVRGNADALRVAHELLDELEEVWRGRLDRFGAVLAGTVPTGIDEEQADEEQAEEEQAEEEQLDESDQGDV